MVQRWGIPIIVETFLDDVAFITNTVLLVFTSSLSSGVFLKSLGKRIGFYALNCKIKLFTTTYGFYIIS